MRRDQAFLSRILPRPERGPYLQICWGDQLAITNRMLSERGLNSWTAAGFCRSRVDVSSAPGSRFGRGYARNPISMRPLFHPSIEKITVEGILHALSDPVRVAIYADIVSQECSQNCSRFLTVSDKTIPKVHTLSAVLREAGLIRGERRGVEVHNTSRCTELEQRFPRLIRASVNAHTSSRGTKRKERNVLRSERPNVY